MGKIASFLFWVLLPLVVAAQNKLPLSTKSLAITRVTILDMTGGPAKPDMTVIVSNNQITSIQPSKKAILPKGAKVVAAKGKFLIPGLWDMHGHTLRTQVDNTVDTYYLPLFIANGVTGVRDMGNSSMSMTEVRQLRSAIETGKRTGPRLFVCGPLIDGKASGWRNKVIVTTEQKGRAAVDSLKKAGADFIKVYQWLSPAVYFAIADEARKQGIPFVGHVPELVTASEASKAGQKSIEHLGEGQILQACSGSESQLKQQHLDLTHLTPGTPEWQEKWNAYHQSLLSTYSEAKAEELLAVFVKNNTWQCPTLTARYASTHVIEASQAHQDRLKYVSTLTKNFSFERLEARNKVSTPASIELMKKQYAKELQLVLLMNKAGVPLLAGTDNGNPFVFPGFSLHDELGLLVEAGLSPLQALQTATLNPANYLGLTASLGTVERGKWADLLLLEANPLENISNTKRIAAVVANGRYYSKLELQQMLLAAEIAAKNP